MKVLRARQGGDAICLTEPTDHIASLYGTGDALFGWLLDEVVNPAVRKGALDHLILDLMLFNSPEIARQLVKLYRKGVQVRVFTTPPQALMARKATSGALALKIATQGGVDVRVCDHVMMDAMARAGNMARGSSGHVYSHHNKMVVMGFADGRRQVAHLSSNMSPGDAQYRDECLCLIDLGPNDHQALSQYLRLKEMHSVSTIGYKPLLCDDAHVPNGGVLDIEYAIEGERLLFHAPWLKHGQKNRIDRMAARWTTAKQRLVTIAEHNYLPTGTGNNHEYAKRLGHALLTSARDGAQVAVVDNGLMLKGVGMAQFRDREHQALRRVGGQAAHRCQVHMKAAVADESLFVTSSNFVASSFDEYVAAPIPHWACRFCEQGHTICLDNDSEFAKEASNFVASHVLELAQLNTRRRMNVTF